MTDFASIINGINQVTQTVGAINGAMNVIVPTAQQLGVAVDGMANAVNPYRNDGFYAPPPGYYPQQGPVPQNMNLYSVPDNSSIMGTVGNALGGAAAGALQGTKIANAIRPKAPEVEGLAAKVSPGAKSVMMSGLKAGGIGAAIGGLFSGVENMMRLSKNEISGSEATGNIVADTTVGFFSGLGGVATGGAAALAMGAMGMAGLPVTIGAAALGLVGAVGMDLLLKKTGIRQSIADAVRSAVN